MNSVHSFLQSMTVNFFFTGVQWPRTLLDLVIALQAPQPQLRPTAAEAFGILSAVDEWATMPHTGETSHN